MMNELKPCPFCGATNVSHWIGDFGDHVVSCHVCFAQGSPTKTEEKAIAAWNRRTNSVMIVDTPDRTAATVCRSVTFTSGKVTMKINL